MTRLQEGREGATVAGAFTLGEWLAGDEETAFFQGSTPEGTSAVIKLVSATAAGGNAPLDLWHRVRQLRHPNLVELLDYGQTDFDGDPFFYAVFEAPDETLAAALSRGPLSAEESREVLDAAVDALRYLHAQGLVIGSLDPDHVVAVGERIKLSTAALRDAETSAAYREDVRLLGDLWRQALLAASPRGEELAEHAADPDPKTRWTLAEIHAALNPPAPVAAPPVAAHEVPPVPSLRAVAEEHAAIPPVRRVEPAVALPESRRTPETVQTFRFPRWILVGTGLFLLILFALNRHRPADGAAEPRAIPTPAAPVPNPAPTPKAPTVAGSKAAPSVAAAKPAPHDGNAVWRVIAFTYRSREAAAKKVARLNQEYPGLNAAVFSPAGQGGYYLVSLGGRMTREDAVRLQHTARGKGLPRDLYVQNYAD